MHFHAGRALNFAAKAEVGVYLRPEHVRLGPLNGSDPPEGTLAGTVRECVFLGATTRLTVALDAGGQVFADVATGSAAELGVGRRVHAGWDGDHARVLEDD